MRKRLPKSLKVSSPILYAVLVLLGFGAGYTTNEFVPLTQRPVSPLQKPYQASLEPYNTLTPTVCFTPSKQCQIKLIGEINKAQKSIYVQAYSFTDREVTNALVDAAKRGVKVKILLDKSNRNDNRSAKDIIIYNRIPLRFDYPPGIAYNKVMVIDQSIIITGSYNFSASAYKRNTENLLVIHNKQLAQQYIQNWLKRWDLSRKGANSNG
jgi:phospholipase D